MRLSGCARTTPPPPKLTVRVALPGNVSTAHVRVVSGSAPRRARARSRTCAVLSIARAPQVTELEEPIDHPRRAVGNFLAFGVDHELRGQRLFVGVRDACELRDFSGQRAAIQPLRAAPDAPRARSLHIHLGESAALFAPLVADPPAGRDGP